MWTDAHAHLYDCDGPGLAAIVAHAREAGVDRILNTGTEKFSGKALNTPALARPLAFPLLTRKHCPTPGKHRSNQC